MILALGCLLAAVAVTLSPCGHDGVFLPGETPALTLSVSNGIPGTVLKADFRTTDYFGRIVAESSRTFALERTALVRTVDFPDLPRTGFFSTTVDWSCGTSHGQLEAAFVTTGPVPAQADRLFGMSAFGDGSAEMCVRLGVGTRAIGFPRDAKLRQKAMARAREYAARGIRVIGHLNALSEKPYAARERTVVELVEAMKDVIHDWATVGEIDLQIGLDPENRARYVDAVRLFSRAIRRADPTATFVALGCSGGDGQHQPDRYPVLRGILPEIADAIDGFGIDQYTSGQTYGEGYVTLDSEATQLREMMLEAKRLADAAGKRIVAIDEKGPCIVRSSPLGSPYGRRMADIVARDFIILKTLPFVSHWLYYRPFNWNPKSVIDWGMWERKSPRQVVSAYAATARLVGGASFVKSLELNPALPCHLFRKDGAAFATLWYNGGKPLDLTLGTSGGIDVRDVEGNAVPITDGKLVVAGSPLYLLATDIETLEQAVCNAKYFIPDARDVLKAQAAQKAAAAYHVPHVSGWDGLSTAEEIVLEDPFRFAPGYADLKSHGLYSGIADLSVRARFGHDGKRFLMEFCVRDDGHRNGNRPPRAFDGDCVQFAFDGKGDWMERKLNGEIGFGDDDSMFVSALARGVPLTYCHVASAENDSRLGGLLSTAPEIVRDEAAGLTRYRVAIPFEDLRPLAPGKGRAFGFSFCVFDRDPGEDGFYRIEMTPGVAGNVDPSSYRMFVLD